MFIRYPTKRSAIPIRHVVPNLITTVALCCGLASMHYALKSDWDRAMFAVLLAAIFDALDGRFARLLKATSPFGAMLDSLADFLSFGVAPAMLLYLWVLKEQEELGLAAVVVFVLCSALRLARFTAKVKVPRPFDALNDQEKRATIVSSSFFEGLPTPAAAACVLIPPMLAHSRLIGLWSGGRMGGVRVGAGSVGAGGGTGPLANVVANPVFAEWGVVVFTFLVASLMVSRVPMFSFKKLRISPRLVVPILVFVGVLVVLAIKDTWLMASLLAAGYVLLFPIAIVRQRWLERAPLEAILPAPKGPRTRG